LVQPLASAAITATASGRRAARRALSLFARNVQDNLELEQGCSGGHGVGGLSLVCLDGRTRRPRLESLFGLPLRDDEVAILALDRAQQLKAQETGLVVNGVCAVREPLLQLGTGFWRYLDCVDLHHGHGVQATEPVVGIVKGIIAACDT
jgi:hypothetical protein